MWLSPDSIIMWGFFINERCRRRDHGILISHVSSQLFLRVQKNACVFWPTNISDSSDFHALNQCLNVSMHSYIQVLMWCRFRRSGISYNPSSACRPFLVWAISRGIGFIAFSKDNRYVVKLDLRQLLAHCEWYQLTKQIRINTLKRSYLSN